MANTPTAMYSQNSTQTGTTLAGAFPQIPGAGVGSQNLDLLQIVSKKGNSPLCSVDYLGVVRQGFTLTGVTVTGSSTVYAGTITGGAANAFAGKKVFVKGFVASPGNNGEFIITASDNSSITVTTSSQVNETHAATALPYTVGTRIGRFASNFGIADSFTLAALVADTFANPSQLDIFQAVNAGGNIHYYLDFQGVAHGS